MSHLDIPEWPYPLTGHPSKSSDQTQRFDINLLLPPIPAVYVSLMEKSCTTWDAQNPTNNGIPEKIPINRCRISSINTMGSPKKVHTEHIPLILNWARTPALNRCELNSRNAEKQGLVDIDVQNFGCPVVEFWWILWTRERKIKMMQ